MSKSSIFSLFVIAIAVIIMMDVKVNDYTGSEADVAETGSVSVLSEASADEGLDPNVIDFQAGDFGNGVENETTSVASEAKINFSFINQVGFQNVTLQMVPFNGILMEKIDMRDFLSVPVVKQNLLEDNKSVVAEFNEFHAGSSILANEIYLLVKEKANSAIDTGINENNDFGEKSFYINYSDKKNSAFLVVKISESVYALRYEKALHSYIKTLLQLLI